MDVQIKREKNTLRAVIIGRLSGNDAYEWYNMVADQMGDEVEEVVLNLAGVSYITSAALRGIILIQKEMNMRDGELVVEDPQEMIMEVLRATGMAAFLDIRKTE